MKKISSILLAITILIVTLPIFTVCANKESGEPLNLDGYNMVFVDEFEGEALNLDVWEYRSTGARDAGFFHPDTTPQAPWEDALHALPNRLYLRTGRQDRLL